MTNAQAEELIHQIVDRIGVRCGVQFRKHYLTHAGRLRIKLFLESVAQQVAFRLYTDEFFVFADLNCTQLV